MGHRVFTMDLGGFQDVCVTRGKEIVENLLNAELWNKKSDILFYGNVY